MPTFTNRFVFNRLLVAGFLFFFSASAFANTGSEPKPNHSDNSLEFTENKNQWHPSVKFMAKLPGGQLYLKNNGFTFSFLNLPDHHHAPENQINKTAEKPEKLKGHTYSVTFLNASEKVHVGGKTQTEGYSNYFIGNDPKKWASNVLSYRQVNYAALYPGIDMQLYQHNTNLKYDLFVKPGANPDLVKMQYDGADKLWLENGNLHIKTSIRSVTEQKPYAYQLINGKEVEVPCEFRLVKNLVNFHFPKGYNKNYELVIDPVLVFSSYTGSTATNWGFTATYDSKGNMYTGGVVFASGFLTSPGAYDVTFNSDITGPDDITDIAIMKFNTAATGQASRLYATYLGGLEDEAPHSLVVNSQDQLLVLGSTSSANFPVSATAYDKTFAGGPSISPLNFSGVLEYDNGSDLIISKFSEDGSALLASTFLGGTNTDGLLSSNPLIKNYGDQFRGDITVDLVDNVYITSSTSSLDFPVMLKSRPSVTFGGGATDAVVVSFSPDLSQLKWSEFYGGSGADAAYSIQVIGDGAAGTSVIIAGGTTSQNLEGTAGSYKPNSPGGIDAFAAILKITSGRSVYATYLGTQLYDQVFFVQLDAGNNIYVLGQTEGQYPVSPGVYSNVNSRHFIHKLSPDLTGSIFSTTFGSSTGTINISPTAFLVDDCERIYACGWGGPTNNTVGNTHGMTVTPNAFKPTTDGADFYLIQLSQNAANLDYATFFGANAALGGSGDHVDGGTSRFDKRGFVYQSVCASCYGPINSFPTTPGAFAPNKGILNGCNNAAFKFNFEIDKVIPGNSQRVCANNPPFQLTGFSPGGGVWSGAGVTAAGVFTPSPALAGTNVLTYTVTVGNCVNTGQKTVTVKPIPELSFTGLAADYCIDNSPVLLSGSPVGGVFSGPGISGNFFDPSQAGPGNHTINYNFVTPDTCTISVSQAVFVNSTPTISASANIPECIADQTIDGLVPLTIGFNNTTVANTFLWNFGDGATSTEKEPTHTYTQPGTYTVTLTSAPGTSCSVTATVATIVTADTRYPNIITPNHDGKNDTFRPLLSCLPTTLKVYNRWGNLVHEQENYNSTWQGENLSDGLYYYLLTDTSGENWKGWVEIVR